MRKFVVLLSLIAVLSCYAEEQNAGVSGTADIAPVVAKMTEAESRLDKLEKEVQKLREEIDRLNELATRLGRALRSLELATQPAASFRPDMETWQSVKKGMTADEVKDMLGNPEEVKELLRGGAVWYYFGMGSITFDRRGRVSVQETFKQLPIEGKVR